MEFNLTGSKISTSSTKIVFFSRSEKTRCPPWPLIGWDIFTFSLKSINRIQQKLSGLEARSQRPLPSLCFPAGQWTKMAALADPSKIWHVMWAFGPLVWNLWLAETFSTSSLQPLNGFQRNLKSKDPILNILHHVCVFRVDHRQHVFHSKKRYSSARLILWPFGPIVRNVGHGHGLGY